MLLRDFHTFYFLEKIKRHKAISFFRAMCLLIKGLLIGTITVIEFKPLKKETTIVNLIKKFLYQTGIDKGEH